MATQPRYEYPESPKGPRSMPAAETASRYLPVVGRALLSAIFLMSAPLHFTRAYVDYAAQAGVPLPQVAVPLSGLMALAGGLSVLLGYRARIGGWLLFAFLIPVAIMMHNFWTYSDVAMRQMQQAHFMKNIALAGAALLICYFGAGPVSLDARRR